MRYRIINLILACINALLVMTKVCIDDKTLHININTMYLTYAMVFVGMLMILNGLIVFYVEMKKKYNP